MRDGTNDDKQGKIGPLSKFLKVEFYNDELILYGCFPVNHESNRENKENE